MLHAIVILVGPYPWCALLVSQNCLAFALLPLLFAVT